MRVWLEAYWTQHIPSQRTPQACCNNGICWLCGREGVVRTTGRLAGGRCRLEMVYQQQQARAMSSYLRYNCSPPGAVDCYTNTTSTTTIFTSDLHLRAAASY